MGGLFKKPKMKTPQSVIDAEAKAKAAEVAAKKAEAQAKADEEYRRTKQRGKAATILTTAQNQQSGTRSLLGS